MMLRRSVPPFGRRLISRGYSHVPSRALWCTARMMDVRSLEIPVSQRLPADAFQVAATASKTALEDELFSEEVKQVQQWFKTPRFNGLFRPYTAEDVVSKRGSLQQNYPSSLMARKLFGLIRRRFADGLPLHTSM